MEVTLLSKRSVLIIDESEENRAVLRTALESQADVIEASRADLGLAMAREHHPDVIVLDLEIDSASLPAIAAGFSEESEAHETPLVLLGSARRTRRSFPSGQFVAKPYHYGPLIRRIEQLLDQAQSSGSHHAVASVRPNRRAA